jgi:hypothetical protein
MKSRAYLLLTSLVFLLTPFTLFSQQEGSTEHKLNCPDGVLDKRSRASSCADGAHLGAKTKPIAPATKNLSRPAVEDPTAPQSLFDAARNRFNPVEVSVEVKVEDRELGSSAPEAFVAGGGEIIEAAGSYGDIMRYLQVLPGVVAASDFGNEVLVRGGHPIENLYLVEGFEIPNINHMARLGSTGGFAPMIDSALVQSIKLHTGGYSARFSDHLSSVTEIDLLNSNDLSHHLEGDFGIQGIGALVQAKIRHGDLLISGHHGLLDVATQDVGLNGVPSYTNELSSFRASRDSGDTFKLLNVAGWDSIEISPCRADQEETNAIDSQYFGWRETMAFSWQRLLSNRSFAVMNVSDSEQVQHIHQQDQYVDPLKAYPNFTHKCPIPKNSVETTPIYMEDSNSAVSSGSYSYEWASPVLIVSAGTAAWLQRPHFDISQPIGLFSPYSSTPVRTDTTSFSTDFSTGETGTFIDLSYRGLRNLSLGLGARLQSIALGGHMSLTSRATARYRLSEDIAVNAAFATYSQIPPYIYLVSFEQNRSLLPMRVHHIIAGLDFDGIPGSKIHVEAYEKPYFDTPASSEFPTVTLHNIPDQLGDEIVWLPMNSKGRGHSSGVELSDTTRIRSRVLLKSSLAYARAKFAGEDRVFRPSDFDFPWIINILSNAQLGRGYGLSSRYGYATGRPYTPYNMVDSLAQNRPIYDLNRMNGLRAPFYRRLDVQMSKDVLVRGNHLEIYAGVDNVLNRSNFLTYAWMPIISPGNPNRYPVKELYQMPIFPNFGVRFIVR